MLHFKVTTSRWAKALDIVLFIFGCIATVYTTSQTVHQALITRLYCHLILHRSGCWPRASLRRRLALAIARRLRSNIDCAHASYTHLHRKTSRSHSAMCTVRENYDLACNRALGI